MHEEKAGKGKRENYAIADLNKDTIIFHIKNIASEKDSMSLFFFKAWASKVKILMSVKTYIYVYRGAVLYHNR